MKMTFEIRCVATWERGVAGWGDLAYRVDLWVGRTRYEGIARYKGYDSALRAAKRTGAKEKQR